ncbi:TetR family transcriptional regulator [Streptomyces sp. CHD11]|uniref:TetR/AcrR family transcriptional regulator n=1 Tax=Streptomyces sp. CHD11 TaxID=2741325 RepID=UPI001BFC1F87|nr:TetR/AcrR family transcriptional regulator [Streptomyces sp. CHD11]MBT3152354.1 TetR family transcriptional regulator [Streptomyces sp. CHD11]
MTDRHSTLRAQRRVETQRAIQAHAVRLFTEHGYDATTVNDVADAAGVSSMTVYRHFPTKEHLVLLDQHGRFIAERIGASPAGQSPVGRIGGALIDWAGTVTGSSRGPGLTTEAQFLLALLRLMIVTPALRAKYLDNHYALQKAIVGALTDDGTDPETVFHTEVVASASLAAMHTALVRWTEEDGRTELSDLIAKALAAAFGDDGTGGAEVKARRFRGSGAGRHQRSG